MPIITRDEISELSVEERLNLIDQIWESLDEVRDDVILTEEQRQELDRRLDDYARNPEAGSPWRDALQRIEDSL